MCGIAAFFSKSPDLEPGLGRLFAPMLGCLAGRGPDSAGFAVYRDPAAAGYAKVVLQHPDPAHPWERILGDLSPVSIRRTWTHAVAVLPREALPHLAAADTAATLMSAGSEIEIFKETGHPADVIRSFALESVAGSHAIGHTRMATESAVTTAGSHPFSTGDDLCLVHNGSLSNHNTLRRRLRREGISFRTENDSEVAAGYLSWRLRSGDSLEQALRSALADLDGFFTFAIGTRGGFAVLRDPIACKPAVLAETPLYVAMASEYRSLAHLPDIESARFVEPEPGKIYSWSRSPSGQRLAA